MSEEEDGFSGRLRDGFAMLQRSEDDDMSPRARCIGWVDAHTSGKSRSSKGQSVSVAKRHSWLLQPHYFERHQA